MISYLTSVIIDSKDQMCQNTAFFLMLFSFFYNIVNINLEMQIFYDKM